MNSPLRILSSPLSFCFAQSPVFSFPSPARGEGKRVPGTHDQNFKQPSIIIPVLCGAGDAVIRIPLFASRVARDAQYEGAERREALRTSPRLRANKWTQLAPLVSASALRLITPGARLTAHRCGGFAPRDRTSGPGRGHQALLIPQAFARVHPDHVQPLKAAPHSWSGRLPEASRTRAYEARAQAPHQPMSGLPDIGPVKRSR